MNSTETAEMDTCTTCGIISHDVVSLDVPPGKDPEWACPACALAIAEGAETAAPPPDVPETPSTSHTETTPPTTLAPAAIPASVTTAQLALWDAAVAEANDLEFSTRVVSARIGQRILDSFELIRPYHTGLQLRQAWTKLGAAFGLHYLNATHREPQTNTWVECALAYKFASDDAKAVIDGATGGVFAASTLSAFAAGASAGSGPLDKIAGLVHLDRSDMTWRLRDDTARDYDTTIAAVAEEGLTAAQTRDRIKTVRANAATRVTTRPAPETHAAREERLQKEATAKREKRQKAKDRAVKDLGATAEAHKIRGEEMINALLGANLIRRKDLTVSNLDGNMTEDQAKTIADALVSASNGPAIAIMQRVFRAFEKKTKAETKSAAPAVQPSLNDSPAASVAA